MGRRRGVMVMRLCGGIMVGGRLKLMIGGLRLMMLVM